MASEIIELQRRGFTVFKMRVAKISSSKYAILAPESLTPLFKELHQRELLVAIKPLEEGEASGG